MNRHLVPTGAALLLALAGCASNTPLLDRQFGAAVSLMTAQQTLNPRAALNRDAVLGIDAQAAKSGYDEYQKTYRAPVPQPNALTIGVGGAR